MDHVIVTWYVYINVKVIVLFCFFSSKFVASHPKLTCDMKKSTRQCFLCRIHRVSCDLFKLSIELSNYILHTLSETRFPVTEKLVYFDKHQYQINLFFKT